MKRALLAVVLFSLLAAPVLGAGGAVATPGSAQETTGVSGALGASLSFNPSRVLLKPGRINRYRINNGRFNPSRVLLKHGSGMMERTHHPTLQPIEGPSETLTEEGKAEFKERFNPSRVLLKRPPGRVSGRRSPRFNPSRVLLKRERSNYHRG